jgi:hypothetical protein
MRDSLDAYQLGGILDDVYDAPVPDAIVTIILGISLRDQAANIATALRTPREPRNDFRE